MAIEVGDLVDYHSVIGGDITSSGHEVLELYPQPNNFGCDVAKICGKAGVVAVAALTPHEAVKARWVVRLDCECPHCHEDVDLLDYADFWDGNPVEIAEHDTPNSTGMEVKCPECGAEFKVDCEW